MAQFGFGGIACYARSDNFFDSGHASVSEQ